MYSNMNMKYLKIRMHGNDVNIFVAEFEFLES